MALVAAVTVKVGREPVGERADADGTGSGADDTGSGAAGLHYRSSSVEEGRSTEEARARAVGNIGSELLMTEWNVDARLRQQE